MAKIFSLLSLFLVVICQNGVSFASPKQITSLDNLSYQERLMLSFFQKNHPSGPFPPQMVVETTPVKPMLEETYFDREVLDVVNLFLLARDWQGKAFPELDWKFGISFCFPPSWGSWCIDSAFTFQTGATRLLGMETISSKTTFEGNKFKYEFNAGDFMWNSPEAITTDVDFVSGGEARCIGFDMWWYNLTVGFSGDINHDPKLGLQISNLDIWYSIGNTSYWTEGCESRVFGGEWQPIETFAIDNTDYLNDYWFNYGYKAIPRVEERLNCFLSNGLYDEALCEHKEGYEQRYSDIVCTQMLSILGFGEMTRP